MSSEAYNKFATAVKEEMQSLKFFDSNVILDYLIPTNTLCRKIFFDLEDGLQMKCAENASLDYIVTENLKDFADSKVKAITIADALAKL